MTKIPHLDFGYVELVETWGSDERIVEAARMSTNKGFISWDPYARCKHCGVVWILWDADPKQPPGHPLSKPRRGLMSLDGEPVTSCAKCEPAGAEDKTVFDVFPRGDLGLLDTLAKNHHDTPFEMAGAIFQIQAPIAEFREHQRHRTQGYNELSARYTPLPDVNYVPTIERLLGTAPGCVPPSMTTNKQAGVIKGAAVLTPEKAEKFRMKLAEMYAAQEAFYQEALNDGVPKELARMPIGVGRYSRMRATANLRNWIGFLRLRMAPGAQWEIRQTANTICEVLTEHFPRTMTLFLDGLKGPAK